MDEILLIMLEEDCHHFEIAGVLNLLGFSSEGRDFNSYRVIQAKQYAMQTLRPNDRGCVSPRPLL
jgi:hypothetical protein